MIDLTGGEVSVVGNKGDVHTFRLSNPMDQDIINLEGTYEAEVCGSGSRSKIELDLSELDLGVLIIPVEIKDGVIYVRRLNPRRTLLTIQVESR